MPPFIKKDIVITASESDESLDEEPDQPVIRQALLQQPPPPILTQGVQIQTYEAVSENVSRNNSNQSITEKEPKPQTADASVTAYIDTSNDDDKSTDNEPQNSKTGQASSQPSLPFQLHVAVTSNISGYNDTRSIDLKDLRQPTFIHASTSEKMEDITKGNKLQK